MGEIKQEKAEKYLTIQALLEHPYFIQINTADISSVIDQYELLLNGEGNMAAYWKTINMDLFHRNFEKLKISHLLRSVDIT